MKTIYCLYSFREAVLNYLMHTSGHIQCNFFDLITTFLRDLLYNADYIFSLCPFYDCNYTFFSAMSLLTGKNRIKFTFCQGCFINGKIIRDVLGIKYILLGVGLLIPRVKITQMVFVMFLQEFAIQTIVFGYALSANGMIV